MKRARQILLGLLAGCVILVLATVLTFTDFNPGPVYEGRSLRSWVVQYRDNRDVNPRSVPGSPHSVREPAEDEPAMRRRFRADKTQAQKEKAEQAAQVIQRAGATCIPHLLKWI